jgi:2-oxoglutarate dehydrogenase E1 component
VTKEYVDNLRNEQLKKYGEDYAKVMADNCDSSIRAQYENPSSKIRAPTMWGPSTGVPKDVLTELFGKLTTWPSDFNIHPIIKKFYAERIKLFSDNEPLDWPTLESLCWGSILKEGYGIRVSG